MRRERLAHSEFDRDMGADRPVLGRDKMQGAVVGPAPDTFQRRRHGNALGDGLADQLDRRRGSGKLHVQGMDDDLVNTIGGGIVGDRRRRRLEGDAFGLGRMGKVLVPKPAAPAQADDSKRTQGAAGIMARLIFGHAPPARASSPGATRRKRHCRRPRAAPAWFARQQSETEFLSAPPAAPAGASELAADPWDPPERRASDTRPLVFLIAPIAAGTRSIRFAGFSKRRRSRAFLRWQTARAGPAPGRTSDRYQWED